MKIQIFPIIALLTIPPTAFPAEEKPRSANTVVLTEISIQNLNIEIAEAEEADFTESVFAIGNVEVLPGKRAVVSSRVEGRAHSVIALPDMKCEQGDELLWVESRQPGDPPPVIRLDAPISGTISRVNIAPGQPISPQDDLLEVVDLSQVEVVAAVPEHLAGKLKKGQKAEIRFPAFPGKIVEAEIAHLGIHAEGGAVEAAFHITNEDESLRPGMRAEFSIITNTRESILSVPLSALQGDPANPIIFIKDYELKNTFVQVPVVVGERNHLRAEIKQGLLPGDEVVINGGYSLLHAGKGNVSLREALDAAHGHPHNEDGSEMTKEQIAAAANKEGGAGGHDHDDDHSHGAGSALLWQCVSGVLLFLLILSNVFLRSRDNDAPAPKSAS